MNFTPLSSIHQDAGGRMVVVADDGLGALQNVGAPDPLVKWNDSEEFGCSRLAEVYAFESPLFLRADDIIMQLVLISVKTGRSTWAADMLT